jgi:hypothetical protein
MSSTDLWTFPGDAWRGTDLTDYDVEALDGGIGAVDDATYEVSSSYIVVDTGPWIFGKKVMLPAGVVDRIDPVEKRVYVNRTKDEIEHAPEFDENAFSSAPHRAELDIYYGQGGPAYRDAGDHTLAGRRTV